MAQPIKGRVKSELDSMLIWIEYAKNEDELERAYDTACSEAWAYQHISLITIEEASNWISKFVEAHVSRKKDLLSA